MQSVVFVTILLAVVASASQPEQVVPNSSPVVGQPQSGPVVQNAPVVSQPPVGSQPVEVASSVSGDQPQPAHQHQHQHQHHPYHPSFASYYAPAGLVNVVGEHGQNKPARGYEQYGQPESASLPPNYKPFGSWGLYIGGNPADGYYTDYYKALGNSVDKPQVGAQQMKPVSSQTAAFSPVLKQASSSPYVGGDHYPFAYAPSELNSGVRGPYGVESHVPVQASSPVYSPNVESSYGVSPYADSYATKKVGAAYAQKEAKDVSVGPTKGYQSRVYVYPSPVAASPGSPVVAQTHHQQQQVVAYPVPVGSQIVGSQPGADGAFNPYGVHAFTRYAVRPTVVNSPDSSYYYSYGTGAQQAHPVYKQEGAYSHSHQTTGSAYYPLSFYGYPLNQLHYSQGSVVPQSVHPEHQAHQGEHQVHHGEHQVHHGAVQPNQVVAASEKQESEDKSPKQQNKA